jgi:hypothetical protein
MPTVKRKHLTDAVIRPKGKFPVAELLVDHHQPDCAPVAKGVRGVITSINHENRKAVFLFPHQELPEHPRVFRDGHIRIVPIDNYVIRGRIDL